MINGSINLLFPSTDTDTLCILDWIDDTIDSANIIKKETELYVEMLLGIKNTTSNDSIYNTLNNKVLTINTGLISVINTLSADLICINVTGTQLIDLENRLTSAVDINGVISVSNFIPLRWVKTGSCDFINGDTRFNNFSYMLNKVIYVEQDTNTRYEFNLSVS